MSQRSKDCEISQKTKEKVWIRDMGQCIFCHKWVPIGCANAHFIKRSQRRFRHRREHSHIMPKMPLRGRFWTKH